MSINKGTSFEQKFKEDWLKAFPKSLCFKIPNQQSGYFNINNYCDFICFNGNKLFMLDCKAHAGASFPFDAFPQFERLMGLKDVPNLVSGIILWLYDKDKVFFVPTISIDKMKKNGVKSFNPDKISKHKYYYLQIPSTKLRTFMSSDYSILNQVVSNEEIERWGLEEE